MAGLKINGKAAQSTAKPARVTSPRKPPIDTPIDWDDPYADPFPEPSVTDPELAASWIADMGVYAQQMVSDLARLARKLDRLTRKLQDPRLADDPHRPDAIAKARRMDGELRELARDIAWHEAATDRTWAVLTSPQRRHADAAAHWLTDPAAARLIGRSWKGIGAMETWPRYWTVRRAWFQGFPPLLIEDMKDAGIWAWKPTPDPPDPFGGELIVNADLSRQLEGRR